MKSFPLRSGTRQRCLALAMSITYYWRYLSAPYSDFMLYSFPPWYLYSFFIYPTRSCINHLFKEIQKICHLKNIFIISVCLTLIYVEIPKMYAMI